MPLSARLHVGGQMARSSSPDFQGGDHRSIAPTAPRVGATEVADATYLVAASAILTMMMLSAFMPQTMICLMPPGTILQNLRRSSLTKSLQGNNSSTAADCFNSVYHENTSANDHTLTLLKEELRPENVKLLVKPSNHAVYQLTYGAMGAVMAQDKALQATQEPLAKAMYRTMRVAEGISSETIAPPLLWTTAWT